MTARQPFKKPQWLAPDSLYHAENTLQRLIQEGFLVKLDPNVVKYNMTFDEEERLCGREAEVRLLEWRLPPGTSSDSICPAGGTTIDAGERVALKILQVPNGHGGFRDVRDEDDVRLKAKYTRESLRKEVNVLKLLHYSGFEGRVPPVLGIVQHRGDVRDPPLFGYVMPTYRFGSLAKFIRNTCDRRVSEDQFSSFFRLHQTTGELSALMRTISAIHAEDGMRLQDISSNNLLINEEKDGSCRLLLADPSTTHKACHLENPELSNWIVATWLWGSSTARYKHFDPTADCYSLSFSFLELWVCAEGATVSLFELVRMTGVDADRDKARVFCRALCVAMLKRQASCPGAIMPRIRRELPVSWLQLWLLLLGTEDFASKEQLLNQHTHRRPAEPDMVAASAELAGVAADVEALGGGGGLTAASLATPPGVALVGRCLRLHERLTALSHLEPAEGSTLVPLDPSLSWVATRFMSQDHPLVAAMRAAQGPDAKHYPSLEIVRFNERSFNFAVLDAQRAADCSPYTLAIHADSYKNCLQDMVQAHFSQLNLVLDAVHTPLPQDLPTRLQNLLPALLSAAPAAAPASMAAGHTGAVSQPAFQLLPTAGPPPACPVPAGHHSMPQAPVASPPPTLAALRAASMPALHSLAQRPAGSLMLAGIGAGIGSMVSSGVPLQLGPAVAPAGLPTAGPPAQLNASAAAALAGSSAPANYSLLSASAAAHEAALLPTASLLPQPAAATAAPPVPIALSSAHMAGPSAAAAAVPRSPSASPPPSLPAVAAGAATPSANLSSHTIAGGPGDASPGDASPATSGRSGVSSPSKRKRGAEQGGVVPSMPPPGTILRFAVSRAGIVAGLPAFRLPPHTIGSNLYAYMVAQLSERFRGDVHQVLTQRQGPYAALLEASGLQPAQLDSLVAGSGSGDAYIKVSATSFLPHVSAADYAAAAPIVFHASSRGSGGGEQQIECGGGSAEQQAQYVAVLQDHLKQCLAQGVPLAYGSGTSATVLFRIAATQLPQGAAAMPWVPHEWEVPAVDLSAIVGRAKHLFKNKK